ncbi:MAG: hypothetical protein QXW41_09590 [Fervidicoccaceae archaeon]
MGHKKGPVIECPKCKQLGREAVIRVKAKGYVYYYRAVIHLDGRKCTLERVKEPPSVESEVEQLRQLVAQLEKENQELRERLARAEARAEATEAKAAAARTLFANGIWLREAELTALRAVYITKKGYSPQQLAVAKGIMHDIVDKGLSNGLAVVCFPPPGAL